MRSKLTRSQSSKRGYSTHECFLYMKAEKDGVPYLLIQTAVESFKLPAEDVLKVLRPMVAGLLYEVFERGCQND